MLLMNKIQDDTDVVVTPILAAILTLRWPDKLASSQSSKLNDRQVVDVALAIDQMLSWLDTKASGLLRLNAIILATCGVLSTILVDKDKPLPDELRDWLASTIGACVLLAFASCALAAVVLRLELACIPKRKDEVELWKFRNEEVLRRMPAVLDFRWNCAKWAHITSYVSGTLLCLGFVLIVAAVL